MVEYASHTVSVFGFGIFAFGYMSPVPTLTNTIPSVMSPQIVPDLYDYRICTVRQRDSSPHS